MKPFARLRWTLLFVLLLFGTLPGASAFAAPLTEAQKIDALIHDVEVMPGKPFVRNGTAYDGKAAANHLRMKLRSASDIRTAQEFIDKVASGSSMSGLPYEIHFADGRTLTAKAYFRSELQRLEAPAPAASPKR